MTLDKELEFEKTMERRVVRGDDVTIFRTIEADLAPVTGGRMNSRILIYVTESRNRNDIPFYTIEMCHQFEKQIPDVFAAFQAYRDRVFPRLKRCVNKFFRNEETEITGRESFYCLSGILN